MPFIYLAIVLFLIALAIYRFFSYAVNKGGIRYTLDRTGQTALASKGKARLRRASGPTTLEIQHSIEHGQNSYTVIGIPNQGFIGCAAFTSIVIPDSITAIGAEAFKGCLSLERITIPWQVISLGDGLFRGCTALRSVVIEGDIAEIGSHTFEGCTALEEVVLPPSIRKIGVSAFANCHALQRIHLPENLSEIANDAFKGCHALQRIEVPPSVKHIRSGAFANCSQLTEAILYPGEVGLAHHLFAGCESLERIECHAIKPPASSMVPFAGIPPTCLMRVPIHSLDAYKHSEGWGQLQLQGANFQQEDFLNRKERHDNVKGR